MNYYDDERKNNIRNLENSKKDYVCNAFYTLQPLSKVLREVMVLFILCYLYIVKYQSDIDKVRKPNHTQMGLRYPLICMMYCKSFMYSGINKIAIIALCPYALL